MSLDARAPALRVVEGERGDLALGVADPHSSAGAGCSAVDDGERDDPVEDGDPHVRALAHSAGPWLHFNSERFTVPSEATQVASLGARASAFRVGANLGSSSTPRQLRSWQAVGPTTSPTGSATTALPRRDYFARPSSRARRPLLGHSRCSTLVGMPQRTRLIASSNAVTCRLRPACGDGVSRLDRKKQLAVFPDGLVQASDAVEDEPNPSER